MLVKKVVNVSGFTLLLVMGSWIGSVQAEEESEQTSEQTSEETKELSGMSILGNSEAPKSLVIVPWKTSEIGDGIGVANMLDERARPVDKDVFVRELGYYELRTGAGAAQPEANAVAKQ